MAPCEDTVSEKDETYDQINRRKTDEGRLILRSQNEKAEAPEHLNFAIKESRQMKM
jgi:hypothetical protein